MITIAAVVSMLLCGPAAFTLTEEPLVLDASGICQVERDGVCLTVDEEREAYDWMADHDFDYQHATYTLMPKGWGIRK